MFLQVYSFFSYKYSGCAEINSARIGCLQTEVSPHANTLVFRRWRNCLTVSVICSHRRFRASGFILPQCQKAPFALPKSLFRVPAMPFPDDGTACFEMRKSLFGMSVDGGQTSQIIFSWISKCFRGISVMSRMRRISVSDISSVKIFYFPFCIFIRFHIRAVFMPCKRTVRTEATYVILWEDKNIQGQIVLYDIKCLYLQPDFVWLRTYNHINLIVTAMWNRHRTDAVNGEAHYYI